MARVLTELQPVRHSAIPRMMFVVLNGFPDIPTAEIIDDVAVGVFDFVPFENLDARLVVETRDVEDLTKRNRRYVTADMRGSEHADDWHSVGEGAEVDEISVGHYIVR